MRNSSPPREVDQVEAIHSCEKQKLNQCQWTKIEGRQLLESRAEDPLLCNLEKTHRLNIRIKTTGFLMLNTKGKAIMGKAKVRKQSQKLWERKWLNLNRNRMWKVNYKTMTIRQSNSISRSTETNTSTVTSITWENRLQTITTLAQYWKTKEKMMKLWD